MPNLRKNNAAFVRDPLDHGKPGGRPPGLLLVGSREMKTYIRFRGFVWFFGGSIGMSSFLVAISKSKAQGGDLYLPFAASATGMIALVGLIELTTGVSFSHWAERWAKLKGWQRDMLGSAIALIALFGLVFIGAWLSSQF